MSNNRKTQKSKFKLHKRFMGKKLLFIILIIVIFIIGAVSAWSLVSISSRKSTDSKKSSESTLDAVLNEQDAKRAKIVIVATNEVQSLIISGSDVSAAASIYDKAVAQTEDPQLIGELNLEKATLYFNKGRYDEALIFAKEAELSERTGVICHFIAQVYVKLNDKQNAIKYYKLTISLVDKDSPLADEDINYYNTMVTNLEKG